MGRLIGRTGRHVVAADPMERQSKPGFFRECEIDAKGDTFSKSALALKLFAFDQFSAVATTYYVASLGGSHGKLCRLDATAA